MCLAVPGRIVEVRGDRAVVDVGGNRASVCTVLTPRAGVDDWVLVHAGFAITQIDPDEARETWGYLARLGPREWGDALGDRVGSDDAKGPTASA